MSESALIADVVSRLTRRYDQLSPQDVSHAVQHARIHFERSPIRDFVPLLVERRAGAELSRHAALSS